MKRVHFTLMSKGGVGKSLVSWLIAQYLASIGRTPYCADTDPTNASFFQFSALKVDYIKIANEAMSIDPANFDVLIERIVAHDGDSVVDNGASSFLPFMRYVHDNGVFDLLAEYGCEVLIHVPLVGGVAMEETVRGLELILTTTKIKVVIWENEYFGPLVAHGRPLRDTKQMSQYRDRFAGMIRIEQRDPCTYVADVRETMAQRLTFDEAIKSPNTRLMRRQRLTTVQRDIYDQLAGMGL